MYIWSLMLWVSLLHENAWTVEKIWGGSGWCYPLFSEGICIAWIWHQYVFEGSHWGTYLLWWRHYVFLVHVISLCLISWLGAVWTGWWGGNLGWCKVDSMCSFGKIQYSTKLLSRGFTRHADAGFWCRCRILICDHCFVGWMLGISPHKQKSLCQVLQ